MIKLYELRAEKGLSQREMAGIMNISQATYNNWENNKTQPSIEQLIALADFFCVSIDLLVGRTDDEYQTKERIKDDFFSLYLALSDEDKLSVKSLTQRLLKR